jgi:hypothetical protein
MCTMLFASLNLFLSTLYRVSHGGLIRHSIHSIGHSHPIA